MAGLHPCVKVALCDLDLGGDSCGFVQQASWRRALADDRATPGAKNSGFFAADAVAIVAEPVLVIDIDGRHDGDVSVDDVHRVEAAAESHLEQRYIELRAREQHQRGKRAVFE